MVLLKCDFQLSISLCFLPPFCQLKCLWNLKGITKFQIFSLPIHCQNLAECPTDFWYVHSDVICLVIFHSCSVGFRALFSHIKTICFHLYQFLFPGARVPAIKFITPSSFYHCPFRGFRDQTSDAQICQASIQSFTCHFSLSLSVLVWVIFHQPKTCLLNQTGLPSTFLDLELQEITNMPGFICFKSRLWNSHSRLLHSQHSDDMNSKHQINLLNG